jgi:hypothetical protein
MSFTKIIKREIEVALSKHSQPAWFKILKYILLGLLLYFFWGSKLLWIILLTLFILAMFLHFWYRYKTRGWTKSYGMWDHDKNKPKQGTNNSC